METLYFLPFYKYLSSNTKDILSSKVIIKKYNKGDNIFHMRDDHPYIYVIIKGFALLEKVNKNNDKRIIFILSKNHFINEVVLSYDKPTIDAYALTDLEVACFHKDILLHAMANDFVLTHKLIESMNHKTIRLYHQIENTTNMMKLKKRICSRLWKLTRDYGVKENNYLVLPFEVSITFLAHYVGSNRETVSRIVKGLTLDNVLSIKNGKCIIYDLERIKNISTHP